MKQLQRLLFTLCVLLCAIRFAPAQTDTSASQIVLRVGGAGGFKLPGKNDIAPRYRADRAIVETFERENPGIRLESAQGIQIAGPAAESGLMLQFAGGTAPDVVYVNFRQSATYIQQGFLEPLDSYLQNDPDVYGRLSPVIKKVLKDVGNGHVYFIPYAQFVQALYYRRDLFQAAGLDPDRPPKDWDEFYDYAKKLTDQPKGKWGFEYGTDPDATPYWWVNFLWQAGGEVVRRNDKGQWEAAFDTPAGVTALEFHKKLMKGVWTGPDGKKYIGVARHSATMAEDRVKGVVAMWFQYQSNIIANTADTNSLNPSLIGIAPMPKGPTGISANEINAASWGISSQIKDPRVRDAAWKFVKFMASDNADRIRTRAYVEAGLASTVNPQSLIKYGYADDASGVSKAWLEASKKLFEDGHPEPYGSNMSQVYTLLGQPLATIEQYPDRDPHMLLATSAREINSKLTGYVDPMEMRRRRTGAAVVFWVLMLSFLAFLGWQAKTAWRSYRASRPVENDSVVPRPFNLRPHVIALLFVAPAALSVLLWKYYPLVRGLVIAFQNYQLLAPPKFVGLDNFIDCFYQPSFWAGVRVSILFTIYNLTFGFFLPIFIALALSEIPRAKMFFRTVYYLPAVVNGFVVLYLWKWFEDSTPQGLFNTIISFATMGAKGPYDWLGSPALALIAATLPGIWTTAGPGSIIYLAALKGVSEEMYEAADLDGASIMTKIRKITLPTLKPLIMITFLGAAIASFQASDTMLVMTGGGPLYATHSLGLEIWYNAFMYLKFGYATAAAWIMGMMLVGFTVFQLRIIKNLKFATTKA
ncbi:MAG: extracellular solute-binding protein [Capsulimonas sp.]|uniref:extracellular solute-binding protein n=1 Tax=Capsulimonas sp. TaxID=2494211 RepID=UPI003262EDC9